MKDGSEVARKAIFEAIDNQIRGNDPPIAKETYDRLRADGHTHEETMKLIGCAFSVELFNIMKNSEPYNAQRYTTNLKGLPELPWEE